MRLIKFISTATITLSVIFILNTRVGRFPPAGKFLSPFHGFWQDAETQDTAKDGMLKLKGLIAPVTVLYDENPKRGFVSSANQYPIDTSYPYRLIGSYASPSRARRINARLAEMEDITPDDFRKLKLDTRNLRAESVLSVLLKFIDRQALSPNETAVFQELLAWNFFAHAEKIAPTAIDVWWRRIYGAIWNDEFGGREPNLRFPSGDRTVKMILEEPHARWYDDVSTEPVETPTRTGQPHVLGCLHTSNKKTGTGKRRLEVGALQGGGYFSPAENSRILAHEPVFGQRERNGQRNEPAARPFLAYGGRTRPGSQPP